MFIFDLIFWFLGLIVSLLNLIPVILGILIVGLIIFTVYQTIQRKPQSQPSNAISQEDYFFTVNTEISSSIEQNQTTNIEFRQTPYKRYKVKGKNPATNRLKTCIVIAKNNLTEKEIGLKSGFLEPYTVTIDSESFEERPPSKQQLDYANDLGILLPPNCTCADVSCLISKELGEDSNDFISNGLICFAGDNNLCLSPYAGICSATCRILNSLENRKCLIYFAYLIYCLKTDCIVDDLRNSQYKDIFYEFGDTYINDTEFFNHFSFEHTHIAHLISKKSFDRRNKNNAQIYDTTYNFLTKHLLL